MMLATARKRRGGWRTHVSVLVGDGSSAGWTQLRICAAPHAKQVSAGVRLPEISG